MNQVRQEAEPPSVQIETVSTQKEIAVAESYRKQACLING